MPENAAAGALSVATREVLETMFFTDVMEESRGHADRADMLVARLSFRGERAGEFRIGVAPDAARGIAANFLGLEDDASIPQTQIGDVAAELANMICGSVLSRLATDVAFDLSHPEVTIGASDLSNWPEEAAMTFDLGQGVLTAAIRFDHN